MYTSAIKNVTDVRDIFFPSVTSTSTQTFTPTLTGTSTFTFTPSFTPTPKEHGIYYMIVIDASQKMLESFDGRTKWDAALDAVNAILEAREEEANYGLVVIGGSESQGGTDFCDQPSTLATPYSSRKNVLDYINQLQPTGGGSIYTAFNLALDQFKPPLPETTVRTLIFITGSSDACESRDEWADLERAFNFPGGIGVKQYSEIIVLEQDNFISRTIEDQFASLSDDLNVQSPTSFVVLNQSNNSVVNTVINNVSNYIDNTIASFPTNTPLPTSTNTPSRTPDFVITTNPPSGIITTVAPPSPPTFTQTWTPIPPTSTSMPTHTPTLTPMPTSTLYPEVLYMTNIQNGQVLNCNSAQECIVDVSIQWVPDTQAQGRNLSVWVRPMPELPDGSGQDYFSQNPPQYQGNGIWKSSNVYIGQIGDYNGMNFAIYVIITYEAYGAKVQLTSLPSNLGAFGLNVKRGNP